MNLRILIVEDNKNDEELLQYELKRSDLVFSSETVQTSETFTQALDTLTPDIILSDYSLPSFDAVSAFHIKQKKYPDIPFIIVSGTIGEENAVELIKSGITDYALKDKLFTLIPKIKRALKDAEEVQVKRVVDEKLKAQNEKLFEIAFLQSHQVRVPIAHILGLFDLFNFDNPADPINAEVLDILKKSAESFDQIIHQIMAKTNEIKAMM